MRSSGRNRSARRQRNDVLSVVVPARNEAASLPRLVEEIIQTLRSLQHPVGDAPPLAGFEIVVVDDGSTDETTTVLRRLRADYPELRPIRLLEGVGQSAAIAAGFRAARGRWVATLDGDLQNDPADLAVLWEALPGFDAVLGWRVRRQDTRCRRIVSHWANRIRNGVLGQAIRDTGCSVRIVSREMALRLPTFHGMHRFIGPLLLREGCRILQLPVNHRPRPYGVSRYNLWNRSLGVVIDLCGVAWLMRRAVRYEVSAPAGSARRSLRSRIPARQAAAQEA